VECCAVALTLRKLFSSFGLELFPKTSGSKGMQVYLPLNRDDVTYDDTKPFAKALAQALEKSEPDLVVSKMKKELRGGKVFVDWSQNDVSKTTIAVYSLRARPRPTVSTPLRWDEVEECAAQEDPDLLVFEAAEVLERVDENGDLFAPVLELQQELPDAI
jgi:bifunctional non-homologous end joining protein LigD